jgi:hypothetical protein
MDDSLQSFGLGVCYANVSASDKKRDKQNRMSIGMEGGKKKLLNS